MGRRRGNGEGAIYQRKSDGKWVGSIDLGFVGGKRRRKRIYGKTRKEVADKLKALHRDIAAGINIAPDQYTVEQFLNRWLNEVICTRAPRTQESYRGNIRNHLIPHIGHYKLDKLLAEHVQALVNTLTAKGLAPRSVEYAIKVLSRALNRAVLWGYVARNVVEVVELPKVKRPRVQPPSEQQARALLEAARGHRLEAAFWVALMLGLRRGEVVGLLKSNIDLAARTIMIEGSLQRVGTRLVRSTTKTDASQRVLPMPTPLVQALREHLQRLEQEREAAGTAWKEQGYLFPSECGTPMEPRNFLRYFKDILKVAGLPDMRFHDLRHWCVALLISYGVHPKAIQDILGHAKITTTLDIYGHLLPTVLRDATEKMAGLAGDYLEEADDDRALSAPPEA